MVSVAGEVLDSITDLLINGNLTVPIAVIFGYFEALLRLGDKFKFAEEETRLKSLNNILNQFHPQDLYEDFAESAYELLQELAAAGSFDSGLATLQLAFNDDNRSKSIMTYIKVCHLFSCSDLNSM